MKKIFFLVIASVIAVFLIIYIFNKKLTDFNSPPPINPEENLNFSSVYLPVSFQYPAAWGQVVEKLAESTRGGTGKIYSLYFDGMSSEIMAGGRSVDFVENRGATEFDFFGFVGRSTEEICQAHQANVFCEQLNENKILAVRLPSYNDLCVNEPGIFGPAALLLVDLPETAEVGGVIFVDQIYNIPDGLCEKTPSSDFDLEIKEIKENILNDFADGAFELGGFEILIETFKVGL